MNYKIVVMGVSGSGKSVIGKQLAKTLGITFFDGDDFHPPENVAKMQSGFPLTDEDRASWLLALNDLIRQHKHVVVSCSALTPAYRAQLKYGNDELSFVYLKGSYDLIWSRLKQRKDHYFAGEEMLKSQFLTLIEPDEDEAIVTDILPPADAIVKDVVSKMAIMKVLY